MPATKKITKTTAPVKKAKSALSLAIYDLTGAEKGAITLPKEAFAFTVNEKLLAQYVRVYQANQRQGNASSKTRGEVTGSTRKIYKQKGTGKARHGSNKAPVFVGGGVVGGPKPKDFSLNLNKKQKTQALFGALTMKVKENALVGLSNEFLTMDAKTKKYAAFLKKLDLTGKKLLVVVPKMEQSNFLLASRNIPGLSFSDAFSVNAFEVLRANRVLFIENAVNVFVKHFV